MERPRTGVPYRFGSILVMAVAMVFWLGVHRADDDDAITPGDADGSPNAFSAVSIRLPDGPTFPVEVCDDAGAPIAGAWVRVFSLPTPWQRGESPTLDAPAELTAGRTDGAGRFRLLGRLPPIFGVHASRPGEAAIDLGFVFEGGARLVLRRAATRRIRLRAGGRDRLPGRVWTRHRIGLRHVRMAWDLTGEPEGEVLELAAGGSIDHVESPGFPTWIDRRILLAGPADLQLDLGVIPRRTLRFSGVAPGAPEEEVRVVLRHRDRTFLDRRIPIDATIALPLGAEVDHLQAAILDSRYMLEGGAGWMPIRLRPRPRLSSTEPDLEVPVRRSCVLAGRLSDESGRPLAGVDVIVLRRREPSHPWERSRRVTRTDARGEWEIRDLEPGRVEVAVDPTYRLIGADASESHGRPPVTVGVTVAPDASKERLELVATDLGGLR